MNKNSSRLDGFAEHNDMLGNSNVDWMNKYVYLLN